MIASHWQERSSASAIRILALCAIFFSFGVPFAFGELSGRSSIQGGRSSSSSPLDSDTRLARRVSIAASSPTHIRLYGVVSRKAGVAIDREAAAAEFDNSRVALAAPNAAARALMDAIASRVLARWEKVDRNRYRLLVPGAEIDWIYKAKNEFTAERYRLGTEFIQSVGSLDFGLRAEIAAGQPILIARLPAQMRELLNGMLESCAKENKSKGLGPTVFGSDLSNATLRMQRQSTPPGFQEFWVNVGVPGVGSSGFRINNYASSRAGGQSQTNASSQTHDPQRFEVKPSDAKLLSELKVVVTLDAGKITFPDAMRLLHEKYGFAYISDSKTDMPQKAEVRIPRMSLGEALDRLTEIFKDTEWEWRKYGFIVIRGPNNPARDPKQGRATLTGTR